jgi:deazaflavin-dependent oxidoreductase (nitroreductase family)
MARSGRVGILTTTGARSGKPRSVPLGYVVRADGTIIVGAGGTEPRAWVANVRAQPGVRFRIRREERAYRARALDGAERETARTELSTATGRMAARIQWGELFLLEPADRPA